MKKLILRILDIKDPETMTFGEIEALIARKFPGYHLHANPGKRPDKKRPALMSEGVLHE